MLWKTTAGRQLSNVRVFISSTFRDMGGERDLLARRVFPSLRQYSEAHGLPLSEIDLRWGITTEEAAEGRVIELCLHEIDACRPYFFCMLGERYGWIDPQASERLAGRFPHLLPFADRSVTELEIRHGAFSPQSRPGDRCFFYFRSPGYIDRLPESVDRKDFANESPLHRERLDALKRDIEKSGFPIRAYADLDEFRDLIERDLRGAIAPAVEAAVIGDDEAGQRGFVTALARSHVEQLPIQSFLDQARGQRKPIVLHGGAGIGKSAALAHWLDKSPAAVPTKQSLWQRLTSAPAAPAILSHFLQIEADADDWLPVAQSLLGDLKPLLGRTEPIGRTPEQVIKQVGSWLALAAAQRPVIVVIDGLERAYRRAGRPVLDWLPRPLPKNVDIILSTRDGALDEALTERDYPSFALAGFAPNDIKTIVRNYLALGGKRLSEPLLAAIAGAPQAATPLFACTVAEELRQFGVHEELQHFLDAYLACPDLTALFSQLLRRLDRDFRFDDGKAASDALALIAASRGGLAESELLDLLGRGGEALPPRPWAELKLAIKYLLIERQGLVDIGPSALRDALATGRFPDAADWRRIRLQLVQHFAARPPTLRIVRELPWQLALLEQWDRLSATLSDPKVLTLGWTYCRRDLIAYWRELERHGHDIAAAYAPLLRTPPQDLAACRALAQLLADLGRRETARGLAAAMVASAGADRRLRLESLSLLAGILVDLKALDDALVVLGRLREEAKVAGDSAILSICLGNLALCANRLGNPVGALAYHAEEEAHCRQTGDMIGLGECLNNYAAALFAAQQPGEALTRWRELEGIAQRWNQSAMLCASLEGQARALTAMRQGKRALPLLDEAAALHREAGDARALRICLTQSAEARASIGDVDGALALYQEIEASSAKGQDMEGVASARIGIARLFYDYGGRATAARHMLQQAAQAASAIADPPRRAHVESMIKVIADRVGREVG